MLAGGGGWRQSQVIHGFDSIFAPVWVSINRASEGQTIHRDLFIAGLPWCITGFGRVVAGV